MVMIPWENGKLKVSENGRFLCHENGAPFFWLADTGWLMATRLTRDEIEVYLEDRRQKGFNVIQVMGMNRFPEVNLYGQTACTDFHFDGREIKPKAVYDPQNYDYWDHMDYAVDKAAEKGIYIALVPVWGSVVKAGNVSEKDAVSYGKWLGRRYRDKSNIIWLNGGDILGSDHPEVWKALGRSIREADPNHLITFHPFGRTQSSTWFHQEPWLDFNMFQSGHRRYDQISLNKWDDVPKEVPGWKGEDNWRYVAEDYAMIPPKPTVDGEPSYEGIPQGLHDLGEPYWTDSDARRYAYWSVFAGAFGHTYGNNAVMQMHKPEFGAGNYGVKTFWNQSIHDPGAFQMAYLKKLMLSVPFFTRIPDPSVINGELGQRYDYLAATRGEDYLFVYTYTGRTLSIHMGKISGSEADALWFSPREGSTVPIGTFKNEGIREFAPPGGKQEGNDWVLILADSDAGYFT